MKWKRPSDENALALSFLDLLSCGMGATVLLFLVFSTINRGAIAPAAQSESRVRGSRSWQSLGVAAPLEVAVTLSAPLRRRDFCWVSVEAANAVREPEDCSAPSSDQDAVFEVFAITFPGGIPQRAFGVRVVGGESIEAESLRVVARQAGEERSYRPNINRTTDGAVTFALDPKTWPAGRGE